MTFVVQVRSRGAESLMSCCEMVEAPDFFRQARALVQAARPVASQSTPPCAKKRLSSAASMAWMTFWGIST